MAQEEAASTVGAEAAVDEAKAAAKKAPERRSIPGNLTYVPTYGALKRALEAITLAERPERVSGDFVATVLKIPGGSGRPIPAILKRMGFLTADGSPTDLYSKFKSETNRSSAALEGLKRAFAEVFRRNEYAHKLDNNQVKDIVVEITGLKKNDPVVTSIVGTFFSVKDFIDDAKVENADVPREPRVEEISLSPVRSPSTRPHTGVALAYNINIILPETTNVQVFNAIFKSLRENLLGE